MRSICLPILALAFAFPAARAAAQGLTLIDEGFRAAQEAMLSSAGGAIRQIGLRTAAGDGPLAALVRDRQAVEERLRSAELQITKPGADQVGLAGAIQGLGAELAALDLSLAADFPRYADLTRPKPLSIAEVQQLLAADEALIATFIGETYAFVWAITPTQSAWHRVNAGQLVTSEAIATLRQTLDPTSPTRGAEALDGTAPAPRGLTFDRRLSAQLYDVFLAPLQPVFGSAQHIYVVPDGPLTSLPFGLLVAGRYSGEDDDPDALRRTPWMIRDHALTTLPSIESLRVVKGLPAPAPDRPVLAGFGDPVFSGGGSVASVTRGAALVAEGLADADRLRSLPPLPATRRELLQIAQTLNAQPTALRLGADATETAVKQGAIGKAQVVAFATHGLLSGEVEGVTEPALVLTPPDRPSKLDDGLLTASEIVELRLDADWVILSACNTAGGAEPGAEGLSGLARAFLFAGARSILVSHWPVRDDAAARLTTAALQAMADQTAPTRAQALRQSMLALIDDTSDPSLAHPSAWAPFVIVGEGG